MKCEDVIEKALSELKGAFKCLPYEQGIGIVTPYLYPDNDLVEIFVEQIAGGRIRVTDLGETLRHLASQGIDVIETPKRKFMFEQIASRLHVEICNGRLEKEGEPQEVGSLLLDVAAAAQGVAGLAYTSKAYEPAEFPEEVGAYLRNNNIGYERHPRIYGMSGKAYTVEFKVNHVVKPEILIETISPSQKPGMSAVVNRVVREWVDINGNRRKISLLNDVEFTWRIEDINILSKWSVIHRWSDKDAFIGYIKGASLDSKTNISP